MMNKKAFTLIELLVVIAIIALLLAIMGPSLTRAKLQAQAVICRSNLKQWALVYALYANDNEDSFPQSEAHSSSPGVTDEDAYFLGALLPYYEDLGLRDCPVTKDLNRQPSPNNYGGTFEQWGPFPPSINGAQWWDTYAEGSYGFNDWVADPPPGMTFFWSVMNSNWAARTPYEEGAYNIPMIFDSTWIDLAPRMNNRAPTNEEHETDKYNDADWWSSAMQYVCIDRHTGGINSAFVDGNVRHVGIKELWYLKWHMNWTKCLPPNAWPTWTDKYKDY